MPATLGVRVEARMLRHAAPASVSGLRNTVAGLKHVGQLTKQYKYKNDRANVPPQMCPHVEARAGIGLGKIQSQVEFMSQVNPKNREQTDRKYLDAVDEILPVLERNKFQGEDLRQMPAESIEALRNAGVFRAVQARQWGGLEVHPVEWFEGLVRIAAACPSSGWVASILGGHAWYTCLYPQRAQEDIWSKNPDARVASSFAPTGKVTREGDGFRLRGRWKYLSGVDHSEWAILGGIIPDDGTGPEMRMFLVPMTDYKIDQSSWHVEGLQGTGSKDIDVDAFVPDYRTQTVEQVYKGIEPGKSVNKSPIFQIPWFTMWSFGLASPATGVALGALQAYVDDNRSRTSALLGTNVAGNWYVHTRLVEAATAINDVKARIPVTWNHIYDIVKSGAPLSTELRIKTRFEGSYTVKPCLEAAIKLLEVSGGGALAKDKVVQLHVRSLMAMKLHPFAIWENMAAPYSLVLFGLPCEPPFSKASFACVL